MAAIVYVDALPPCTGAHYRGVAAVTVLVTVTQLPLSVVMPVWNEAPHLPATIDALVEALGRSKFDAELVLVDDGSTDGSAEVARAALDGRLPFKVVVQENKGRFEARRVGLEASAADLVLLLDGRVLVEPSALEFVSAEVAAGAAVWTGHVHVDDRGNPFGIFWRLIAELAWADYFDRPRRASFDGVDFDRYPKGTTCFLAPKELLVGGVGSTGTGYADTRFANDDTPLIRWISERTRVNVSPEFACVYRPRATLASFSRHSVHRGIVFLDGHGTPESRFFAFVVAFYPLSLVAAVLGIRKPARLAIMAAAVSSSAACLAVSKRKSGRDVLSLALLAPVYVAAHGVGMWRGLAMLAGRRLRQR